MHLSGRINCPEGCLANIVRQQRLRFNACKPVACRGAAGPAGTAHFNTASEAASDVATIPTMLAAAIAVSLWLQSVPVSAIVAAVEQSVLSAARAVVSAVVVVLSMLAAMAV